jgi:erythromycin esterase-like protein
VGDLRGTQLGQANQRSLGTLTRQRHPEEVYLIGLSTYQGTMTATSEWGGTVERMRLNPALEGSYEWLFHQTKLPSFALALSNLGESAGGLREERLERAIGIVYQSEQERLAHYFRARLPEQFDAVVHVDQTHALEPLERSSHWDRGEAGRPFPPHEGPEP